MRHVLLAIALLLCVLPAGAAVAFVQESSKDTNTVTSDTITLTTTAGNFAIIYGRYGLNTTAVTCSETTAQGDTFLPGPAGAAYTQDSSGDESFLCYAQNLGGGSTTFKVAASAAHRWSWGVWEYSGVATTSALDQKAAQTGNVNAQAGMPTNSITTTGTSDLVFAGASIDALPASFVTTGWTNRDTNAGGGLGNTLRAVAGDQLNKAAGTYGVNDVTRATGTFTMTSPASGGEAGIIVSFFAAAAPSKPPGQFPRVYGGSR